MTPFDFSDSQDSLLDLLADAQPRKIVLASVHRPTFSQQLTVLKPQRAAGDTQPLVAIAQAFGPKSSVREIDLPLS
jgi:hypothetical protein